MVENPTEIENKQLREDAIDYALGFEARGFEVEN